MVKRASLHLESERHHSADENRSNSILLQSSFNQAMSLIQSQAHRVRRHLRNHRIHPDLLQISFRDYYIISPFLIFIILTYLCLV